MNAHLVGRATIKYNGKVLRSDKGAKLILGGVKRTPVVGDQYHGYTEEVYPAKVECTFGVSADTDLEEIKNIKNGTITFECDNGLAYVLNAAVYGGEMGITAEGGGKCPGDFFAKEAVKL